MSGIFYQDHSCTGTDAVAPTLVLLHGWGMHSAVWEAFIPLLTPYAHVRCIDLPGSGRSSDMPMPASPEVVADLLLEVAPAQAVWIGWSLGGLLAMTMAARHPQRVSHLVLMAATPCFLQREDWHDAMSARDFGLFAEALQQDVALTLKRFLALQCHGSASHKQDLRFLQSCVAQQPVSSREVMDQALAVLGDNDRRTLLSTLSLPVLCLLGEYDALVPASVAPALSSLLPSSTVRVVPGAAHVPFLSHPQACRDAMLNLIGAVS